jgi:membrane protein implicated in regulation of membrane protease activity
MMRTFSGIAPADSAALWYCLKMEFKPRKISGPICLRYVLLNIPELAAVVLILIIIEHWAVLPFWLFWSIIGFWIVKDALLFPFVWRAYDWNRSEQPGSMIGAQGIAKQQLAPSGYVRIHGELWRAERIGKGPPIEAGQTVRVEKMEGLTLFVVPGNKTIDSGKDEFRG